MRKYVPAALAAIGLTFLAACGGGSGTGAAGAENATPTTSATSPTKSSSAGKSSLPAAKLVKVSGYTYLALPADLVKGMADAMGSTKSSFSGLSVKTVTRSGNPVAMLVVMEIAPAMRGLPGVEKQMVPAVMSGVAGKGVKVTNTTVHGQRVALASGQGQVMLAWYRKGQMVMLVGDTKSPMLTFAKLYIARS